MRNSIKDYTKLLGYELFSVTMADEVLLKAVDDGVTELTMTGEEYKVMRMYLMVQGITAWNWDKKTVWGIKLIIE